jgi:hypothetical protein
LLPVPLVQRIGHYFAGLLNADEQLPAAGQIPAVGVLFMVEVPLSLLSNLIVADESRSNGLDIIIPFRLSVFLKRPLVLL